MDQIERASIAMCGGPDMWAGTSEQLRDQYRELARRAAAVLVGKPVPSNELEVGVKVVLARRRPWLSDRKPGDDATTRVAREVVDALRLSGYQITYGPPAEMANTGQFLRSDRRD